MKKAAEGHMKCLIFIAKIGWKTGEKKRKYRTQSVLSVRSLLNCYSSAWSAVHCETVDILLLKPVRMFSTTNEVCLELTKVIGTLD